MSSNIHLRNLQATINFKNFKSCLFNLVLNFSYRGDVDVLLSFVSSLFITCFSIKKSITKILFLNILYVLPIISTEKLNVLRDSSLWHISFPSREN